MEGIGLLVILLGIYMTPWFIALIRSHRNVTAIFALNLLLGWTLIGWVGALVWALMNQNPPPASYPQHPQHLAPPHVAPPPVPQQQARPPIPPSGR